MQRQKQTRTRPLRRRLGRTAAVLSLLTSAACTSADPAPFPFPGPVPAGGESAQLPVATWNMCGVRQWSCEETGSPKDKFQQLRALVDGSGVRVVLLQEVCSDDLLAAALRLGSEWHSAFEPYVEVDAEGHRTPVDCTGQGEGQAGYGLLAASPLTDVEPVQTQQPTVGLHRGILCASVPVQGIRVCNAHIAMPDSDVAHPDWELRDDQLRSLVAAVADDGLTVIGGDFNAAPPGSRDAAAWIWPPEMYSAYQECDQKGDSRTGRPTYKTGTKIDYLFTNLPRTACDVVDTKDSDHRPLVMRVSRPTAGVSTAP